MALRKVLILVSMLAICACASEPKNNEEGGGGEAAAEASADNPDAGSANKSDGVNPDLAQDTLGDAGAAPEKSSSPPAGSDGGLPDQEPPPSSAKSEPPPSSSPPSDPMAEPAPAQNEAPPPPKAAAQEAPAAPLSADEVEITNVRYLANKSGGTVLIETSGPAMFRRRQVLSLNQVIIEVANARLPVKLKRPLLTKDFKQAIASIYAYQDDGSKTARFVIQFRDAPSPSIQQEGKQIMVSVNPPGDVGTVSDDAGLPSSSDAIGGVSDFSGSTSDGRSIRFYGKEISLEVRDAPVQDVLNFIAEQTGTNIMVSNDVKGTVTLKLKQVPWDQALFIIMKSQQLGYVREGKILRVAPLDTIRNETDKAVKVLEAQRSAQPLKVRVIPVSYAQVGELAGQAGGFVSARGKVVADPRTSSLIVTDIVENIDRITNLVKALDTPPYQVLIEGKVVEATEEFIRGLGVNLSIGGGSIQSGSQTLTPNLNIAPTISGSNLLDLTYGTFNSVGDLTAKLALLEKEQQAKIISSPRVVVINNQPASISQTVNIVVPKTTATAPGVAPQTTYDFKPIKLNLDVTPQVTSESDVIMQVAVTREFAIGVAQGGVPPNIAQREAKTKVMVRNGQTAVIGGIYQADSETDEEGFPGLRKLPVLGWLFKSRSTSYKKNELLVFLTPRILGATGGENKAEPKTGED